MVNNSGPAFPTAAFVDPETLQTIGPPADGMTLRDWFAGMAIQGLARNVRLNYGARAWLAYQLADAMLIARENLDEDQ